AELPLGKSQRRIPRVDDVVLVYQDKYPRYTWPLGLVIKLHPGDDGAIRSAAVRFEGSELKRPVNHLIPLEVPENPRDPAPSQAETSEQARSSKKPGTPPPVITLASVPAQPVPGLGTTPLAPNSGLESEQAKKAPYDPTPSCAEDPETDRSSFKSRTPLSYRSLASVPAQPVPLPGTLPPASTSYYESRKLAKKVSRDRRKLSTEQFRVRPFIPRNSPARPRCSPSCLGRKKMFGRSTTDTEITEASYGPKNRRKGNDFHIGSLNVRSISDQSKAEAFDLLAVNSGCKVIALQETKRKEGEWILSSGAELICTRREARERRTGFLDSQRLARYDHRLLRARFRSTAKKEKSRKFAKTKRAGGERSWDPVRFKNTITEMLTENPPTCYEELTESIRSAASTATHATHQLSRISEATKKMMLSRFQMIHAGQTKNSYLAKINYEFSKIFGK
uniref:DUF5641 domain-containing protein n=1 Tax=Caenorhabditis japonica TaxID=281687 RepID=A0A8R1IWK1_CAEJA